MKKISIARGTSRRRLVAAVGMVAATSILAAACGTADSASAGGDEDGPFVLYASLGTSGSNSSIAASLKSGLEAAVTRINDNGGLLDREMELEVENNESDPTKAVSLMQKRIREDAPDVTWAGTTSSETLALQTLTTRQKIIALNNASAPEAGDASQFPYSFSAGVRTSAIADYLAAYLTEKGYEKVGVLSAANAFGDAVRSEYESAFEEAGMTVVAESYEQDAVEMDGPLARISDKNPDVVVFNDFVHPSYVLKSRTKVGMDDTPFVGDLSTTLADMSDQVSEQEKKDVMLASYTISTTHADRPGVEKLLETLDEAGVDIKGSLYLYALAYDTVLAYANAVESVGSTDVDKVRAAMEKGAGETYELGLADDLGWTETEHLGSGEDQFTMIPISPLKAGQFQVEN